MNDQKIRRDLVNCAVAYIIRWNLIFIPLFIFVMVAEWVSQGQPKNESGLSGYLFMIAITFLLSMLLSAIHCFMLWKNRNLDFDYSGKTAVKVSCISTFVLLILLIAIYPYFYVFAFIAAPFLAFISGLAGLSVNRLWEKQG